MVDSYFKNLYSPPNPYVSSSFRSIFLFYFSLSKHNVKYYLSITNISEGKCINWKRSSWNACKSKECQSKRTPKSQQNNPKIKRIFLDIVDKEAKKRGGGDELHLASFFFPFIKSKVLRRNELIRVEVHSFHLLCIWFLFT